MLSLTALAILLGVLVLFVVSSGSGSGVATVGLVLFIIVGIASGLLPGLGLVAGVNNERFALSLAGGSGAVTERDGVSIGECTWEPETERAFFTIANGEDQPMRAQVDVIFGEARPNRAPMQIHGERRYPAHDRSWLLPPNGLPGQNQPDYSPAWTIQVRPPSDDDRNPLITWCYVTIASVEQV